MTVDAQDATDDDTLVEGAPRIESFLPKSATDDDQHDLLTDAAARAGLSLSGALRQEISVDLDSLGPARTAPLGHPFAMRSRPAGSLIGQAGSLIGPAGSLIGPAGSLIGIAFVIDADIVGLADLQMGGTGTAADRSPSALEQDLALGLLVPAFAPLIAVLAPAEHGVNPRGIGLALAPMEDTVALPRRSLRLDIAIVVGANRFSPSFVIAPAADRAGSGDDSGDTARAFAGVPVEVSIGFDPIATPAAELMDLAVGDVLCLDHRSSAPLLARVGSHELLRVTLGRRGAHAAVQVTELIASGEALSS